VTEDEISTYLHGRCHVFAIAMSELSGLPMRAVVTFNDDLDRFCLVHAWVEWPDGRALDAAGLRDVEEMLEDYDDADPDDAAPITAKQLLRYGEGSSRALSKRRLGLAVAHAAEVLEVIQASTTLERIR